MKYLIAGSNGMIGSAVTRHLIGCGDEVMRLVRHSPGPGEAWWNPEAGEIDRAGMEGFDGEAVTAPASEAGIRAVHLRIPPVMGGSALRQAGFRVGNGRQWASWVGRDELAAIIEFTLTTGTLAGPVNAVSPNPLRNAEFATTASQAVGKKSRGSMPAFMVRLVMGEMGEELMLASRRIQPAKLLKAGDRFRFPELGQALRHEMESLNAGLVSQPV